MRIELDPQPAAALDRLWTTDERLAERIEDALDWIEADPIDPKAKRRAFSNGIFAIPVASGTEDWLILWRVDETDSNLAVVAAIIPDSDL